MSHIAGRIKLEKGAPLDIAVPGPRATNIIMLRPVAGAEILVRWHEEADEGPGFPLGEDGLSGVEVGTSRSVWIEAPKGGEVDVLVDGAD